MGDIPRLEGVETTAAWVASLRATAHEAGILNDPYARLVSEPDGKEGLERATAAAPGWQRPLIRFANRGPKARGIAAVRTHKMRASSPVLFGYLYPF